MSQGLFGVSDVPALSWDELKEEKDAAGCWGCCKQPGLLQGAGGAAGNSRTLPASALDGRSTVRNLFHVCNHQQIRLCICG